LKTNSRPRAGLGIQSEAAIHSAALAHVTIPFPPFWSANSALEILA
jgi:hypothetical protein